MKDVYAPAVAAVIEAQRQIWQLWQDAASDDPVEERLDYANGELVNIIEDLRPFSATARAWSGVSSRIEKP